MNVAVCVPRRSDGGRRDELWEFCRPWWIEFGPIFEGASPDGPFNRSAAINDAVRQAGPRDVYLIVDGDVICNPDQVWAAIRQAGETGLLSYPFTDYVGLSESFTQKVLDGFDGNWRPGADIVMQKGRHVSSVLAVPRALWEKVGGFDERFSGWGWDDLGFEGACKHAGKPVRQKGTVWHLWHPTAPENTKGADTYRCTPSYMAGCELARRWRKTTDLAAMVAESRDPDQIVAVCLTTGTRDTLAKTIASFDENVSGPIGRKVIIVDGIAKPEFIGWETVNIRGGGFARATAAAIRVAIGSGQPWVFHLEDDFLFDRPVDLSDLQAEMDAHPDLAQMSLLRQAWYRHEIEAGGIVEANPEAFEQRGEHLRHREYWTTNPHLTRRLELAGRDWPLGKWSESQYSKLVFEDSDVACGIWGDGSPWITHIGETKAGTGY